MCGFAGFRLTPGRVFPSSRECLQKMGEAIRHRGPDADGIWFDTGHGLGFSHRRLSIQDISPLGSQPMQSASGRYTIVFNGEIYNFLDLRTDLTSLGHVFRGGSDTEVMLAAIEAYGLESAVTRFEGMFGFALYDAGQNLLHLVRDRMGEKPVYYGWHNNKTFLFGSELHALRCHPDFDDAIDRNAVGTLLKHNYIPAPRSIYRSTRKLEPASILTLNLESRQTDCRIEKYWSLQDCYSQPLEKGSRTDLADSLERHLGRSIGQQMISDVPLGAFLSGGVDSSTVVALMQAQSSVPVNTFTIGFEETEFNEANFASDISAHLGTRHTELYVTAEESLNVIPGLPLIYDEPFADSSQIPTYLVCKLARQNVTVSLSGDGGDELFCGYQRYFDYVHGWRRSQEPGTVKRIRGPLARAVPGAGLAALIKLLVPSQRAYSISHIQEKLSRQLALDDAATLQEYYANRIVYWHESSSVVLGTDDTQTLLDSMDAAAFAKDEYRQLMLLDSLTYLPDDILVKVDRAAMANSLETRVPFLNHRIVEFAARIPPAWQTDGINGKLLLRDILYRYVPKAMIEREKKGFAVPMKYWLRSSLKEWASDMLNHDRLVAQGYFDAAKVGGKWREHIEGRADHSFQLWGVLCFQSWLDHSGNGGVR